MPICTLVVFTMSGESSTRSLSPMCADASMHAYSVNGLVYAHDSTTYRMFCYNLLGYVMYVTLCNYGCVHT